MKRKVDCGEEEKSDHEHTNASENDESDNEEPRIKDVLEGVSQLVSRQKASDLLHSLAASKDILFWTPRGQLLRNQRMIPVTNISELAIYNRSSNIWIISYILHIISLLTGRYELNKLTSLLLCGFIAQLVEHRTGIAEVTGSNPV